MSGGRAGEDNPFCKYLQKQGGGIGVGPYIYIYIYIYVYVYISMHMVYTNQIRGICE